MVQSKRSHSKIENWGTARNAGTKVRLKACRVKDTPQQHVWIWSLWWRIIWAPKGLSSPALRLRSFGTLSLLSQLCGIMRLSLANALLFWHLQYLGVFAAITVSVPVCCYPALNSLHHTKWFITPMNLTSAFMTWPERSRVPCIHTNDL